LMATSRMNFADEFHISSFSKTLKRSSMTMIGHKKIFPQPPEF
jgi:hypothetical protein